MTTRTGHSRPLLVGALALALTPAAAVAAPVGPARGTHVATVSTAGTAAAAAAARRTFQLRVATWNISGVLNDRSGRKHRPWTVRRHVVARQLLGQAPSRQRSRPADVIAVQEANTSRRLARGATQYTDLVRRLNGHAHGRDRYRTVRPRLNVNATRIVYNAHRLRLIRAGRVQWRAQEMHADGARMMAWATFRTRATGARFFFASVHLETSSKRVRLRQWRQLVRVVPHLAHRLPVVIGGDFNATRMQRDAARVMLWRMHRAGFGDALGQRGPGMLTVGHARPGHVTNPNFNSVNFYKRYAGHYRHRWMVGQSVDYVFASNRLRVRSWGLVADHAKGRARLRGVIPSDHNLIRTTLLLR